MKEKQKRIIESAIKLFAEHGFHNTSVQEIANLAGVSKGSVYLYFESKEEILLNVFYYYSDLIRERILSIQHQTLSPKEKLIKQIQVQLEEVYKHHDFFMMHLREQNVSFNSKLEEFMKKVRLSSLGWLKEIIQAAYGNKVDLYLYDLCMILDGFIQICFKTLIVDQIQIEYEAFSRYIVKRFDDVVEGLIQSEEPPLLTDALINNSWISTVKKSEINIEDVKHSIEQLKKNVMISEDPGMRDSLEILAKEIHKKEPKAIIIQGMLANIEGDASIHQYKQIIANYYHVKCL